MNLWFVFALMTVAAIFAVLWPLGRRSAPQSGGSEESVYRDQLAEADRDLAGGLIAVAGGGDSPDPRAPLGEARPAAGGGVATNEAKEEFDRAGALNGEESRASFFPAVAAEQAGRSAAAAWMGKGMRKRAPADAPWR